MAHCLAVVALAALAIPGAAAARLLPERSSDVSLPPELLRHVLSLLPVRPLAAWSSGGSTVVLAESGSQAAPLTLSGHTDDVNDVKFLPGAQRLVTVDFSGVIIVWDVWSGEQLHVLRCGECPTNFIVDVQVFPDGDRVAVLQADQRVAIWSARRGQLLKRFVAPGRHSHMACRVFPDGRRVATGVSHHLGDEVVIWDVDEEVVLRRLWPIEGLVYLFEVSSCGSHLVTVTSQGTVLWDTKTAAMRRRMVLSGAAQGWVSGVAATRGGDVVASIGSKVFIWDGATGRVRLQIPAGGGLARFVLLQGEDKLVAFSSSGASVWSIAQSATRLRRISAPEPEHLVASSGQFAACGSRGRAGAEGAPTRWFGSWDVATGGSLVFIEVPSSPLDSIFQCSVAAGTSALLLEELTR